jgi:hypothetical protein
MFVFFLIVFFVTGTATFVFMLIHKAVNVLQKIGYGNSGMYVIHIVAIAYLQFVGALVFRVKIVYGRLYPAKKGVDIVFRAGGQDKFIAAVTGGKVAFSDAAFNDSGHIPQGVVPLKVSQRVVYHLEMVHVYHHNGTGIKRILPPGTPLSGKFWARTNFAAGVGKFTDKFVKTVAVAKPC